MPNKSRNVYRGGRLGVVRTEKIHMPMRPYTIKMHPSQNDLLSICSEDIMIPHLKVAHFKCTICSHVKTITLERGRISEPKIIKSAVLGLYVWTQHHYLLIIHSNVSVLQSILDYCTQYIINHLSLFLSVTKIIHYVVKTSIFHVQ